MAKGNSAKGRAARPAPKPRTDAKDAATKGAKGGEPPVEPGAAAIAAKGGNGTAPTQSELAFAESQAAPVAKPVDVVELVNGVDGVWKRLSNGKRVDLTTKEWRQELARLFTRAPAP